MFKPTEALSETTFRAYHIFTFIFVWVKSLIEHSKVICFNTFQGYFSSCYFGVLYWWGYIYLICSNKLQDIGKFSLGDFSFLPAVSLLRFNMAERMRFETIIVNKKILVISNFLWCWLVCLVPSAPVTSEIKSIRSHSDSVSYFYFLWLNSKL